MPSRNSKNALDLKLKTKDRNHDIEDSIQFKCNHFYTAYPSINYFWNV